MWQTHKKIMLTIFLLAFLVRIGFTLGGWIAQGPTHPYGDSDGEGYHWLAKNLLAGHGFSWNSSPPYAPTQFRQPVYPMVLSGLYALGFNPVGAGIVQNALGAGTAVFIFIAGISWLGFNLRGALGAALLF